MKVRKWIENAKKFRQSKTGQIRQQFQAGEPSTATTTALQPYIGPVPTVPWSGATMDASATTILKSPLSLLQGIIRNEFRVLRGHMRLALG